MLHFVLTLAALSTVFTLTGGAALLLRRRFLRGREGIMYPVWIVILILAVLPIRIHVPPVVLFETAEADCPSDAEIEAVSENWNWIVAHPDYGNYERIQKAQWERGHHSASLQMFWRRMSASAEKWLEVGAYLLFSVWVIGAVGRFVQASLGYFGAKRLLLTGSLPCVDGRVGQILDDCRKKLKIRRRIVLRQLCPSVVCPPCVIGCLRPVICIDAGVLQLSDRELACVLTHELNHIRRGDMFCKLLALSATSIHWFNPIAGRVLGCVYEDCELSCDYGVIRALGRGISGMYMNTILGFAESYSAFQRKSGVYSLNGGLFMSVSKGAASLRRRFENLKNYRESRLCAVILPAFIALCIVLNGAMLSSFMEAAKPRGTVPGLRAFLLLDEGGPILTLPVEDMIRTYYGLSPQETITPAMLEGIETVTVSINTELDGICVLDFSVNSDAAIGAALPALVSADRFETLILPKIGESAEDGRRVSAVRKMAAFYDLKNPDSPDISDRERESLLATHPDLGRVGACYLLDPGTSRRERSLLYGFLLEAGLLRPRIPESDMLDASSFAYFPNLREVTFEGIMPVNYTFPDTVKVTLGTAG